MNYHDKKFLEDLHAIEKQIPFELLFEWLTMSKNKKNSATHTIINQYLAQTLYSMCQKMILSRDIYFLSLEIMKRIIDIKKNRYDCKDLILNPTMSMLIAVLLAYKISGHSQCFFQRRIVTLARELGYGNFNLKGLAHLEFKILTWIQFDLPNTSPLDDLYTLLMVILRPVFKSNVLTYFLLKQSTDIFTYIQIYMEQFLKVLKDSYSVDEIKKSVYESLSQQNLFFPTGVILYTLMVNKKYLNYRYSVACHAIALCTATNNDDFITFMKVVDFYVENVFYK